MKIRKLAIQNYKIFDDVSFDFTDENGETLSTVVLAGMNGCGKTTVLEVLVNIFNSPHKFSTEHNLQIEFDFKSQEQDALLNNYTYNDETPFWKATADKIRSSTKVLISGDREIRFLQVVFKNVGIVKYIYFPVNHLYKDKNYILDAYGTVSMQEHKGYMKTVALKSIRDEILMNRDKPPRESIERQIENITKILAPLDLNTRLVDLESEELIFESANGKRIYFEQLSHGEQHLYFRAIYLSQLNLKDAVILIDEPEAAFHPTWQQKIATLYSNVGENNQVFMATHSPHIMASVPPESLFVLNVDEETKKVTAVNMGKAGKHSQGLEPNRILKEVMQVDTLREYQTQVDIERLTALLTIETFEGKEAQGLIEKLTDQLGQQDPFIIRLEHQLLMLNRKKQKPVAAE